MLFSVITTACSEETTVLHTTLDSSLTLASTLYLDRENFPYIVEKLGELAII